MSDTIEQELFDLIKCKGRSLTCEDIKPYLEQDGFDINQDIVSGSNPPESVTPKFIISQAVKESSCDVIELLLQYKPELNYFKNNINFNPVHMAVMSKRTDVLDLLVKHGSGLDLEALSCHSIGLEIIASNFDIVKIILDNYEDSNLSQEDFQKIFVISVGEDRYDIAKLLLERGRIDTNFILNNLSALEHVFYTYHIDNVEKYCKYFELLIDHGADILQLNSDGKNILDLILNAENYEYEIMIDSLLKGYLEDVEIRFQEKLNKEARVNLAQVSSLKKKMATRPKIGGLKI